MKRYFIKNQIKKNRATEVLKNYPRSIKNIGIIFSETEQPDENFIAKLKECFGNQTQFFNFALINTSNQKDHILLNSKSFDFLGRLKNENIYESIFKLDMIIDMSLKSSVIKDYALSLNSNSYKITLGLFSKTDYHLCVNIDNNQKELFADEIIKYHNILSHAKK